MTRFRFSLLAVMVGFVAFLFLASAHAHMEGMDMGGDNSSSSSMGGMGAHMKVTPHMTMTELRPTTPADTARGEEIIRTMREKLAKYEDYSSPSRPATFLTCRASRRTCSTAKYTRRHWRATSAAPTRKRGCGSVTSQTRALVLRGTIADAASCAEAGGNSHEQIFGWMVHVYPFASEDFKVAFSMEAP